MGCSFDPFFTSLGDLSPWPLDCVCSVTSDAV